MRAPNATFQFVEKKKCKIDAANRYRSIKEIDQLLSIIIVKQFFSISRRGLFIST